MYHVIAPLEARFPDLQSARDYAARLRSGQETVKPSVPDTAQDGEDKTTPRICVAPYVEDCITALGVTGLFRRCLNSREDAKSYENDDEAYPIMVLKFADGLDYIKPTKAQVPDAGSTHEHWLLTPASPVDAYIAWLDAYSIKYKDMTRRGGPSRIQCTGAVYVRNINMMSHPWLDGGGHPLDCDAMGSDPWPDKQLIERRLMRFKGTGALVYARPVPGSGFFQCVDAGGNKMPFLTDPSNLIPYTGFVDANGRMLFSHDRVEYKSAVHVIVFYQYMGWALIPMAGMKPVWLHDLEMTESNGRVRLTGVTLA